MKALSIRQPFAHLIMIGEKSFEFRTWQTDYRGDLLICASANPKIENTIPGHALCVANLEEVYELGESNYESFGLDEEPEGTMYAWYLTNIRLINPFPVKGKLHLFDVEDDLIEYISCEKAFGEVTDENLDKFFDKYYLPKLYKGKKK